MYELMLHHSHPITIVFQLSEVTQTMFYTTENRALGLCTSAKFTNLTLSRALNSHSSLMTEIFLNNNLVLILLLVMFSGTTLMD